MKKFSLVLTGWLIFPLLAVALQVTSPPDQLQTFSDQVKLFGIAPGLATIKVNGESVPVGPEGDFLCGLLLRPGKNLVRLEGGGEVKEQKILRLLTFPDLERELSGKKHWARPEVVNLATLGLLEGDPDGNFYPGRPVSRGEFASWLVRVDRLPLPTLDADPFFDVPKEHWRAPYVKAAVEAEHLSGYSTEEFGPDDPLTRQEGIALIARFAGLTEQTAPRQLFLDLPSTDPAAPAVYSAFNGGLVKGLAGKLSFFAPEKLFSRGEVAVVLSRIPSVKEEIGRLYDFNNGYSDKRLCGVNVAPQIISFTVEPKEISSDQTSRLIFQARTAPRGNSAPLVKGRVDLSALGGVADAQLFDDGEHGDQTADDGVYSLITSFNPGLRKGIYKIKAIVIDELGWEGEQETEISIK